MTRTYTQAELDAAVAAARAEGMKEMLEIYTRAEQSGGCGETAMRMAILDRAAEIEGGT